ncbi:MAG TPA: hypothetical protein VIY49_16980 [Bryobacteraceae bacterium]
MRILIDECVNPRRREAFPDHEVVAAVTTAWRQIRDHRLVDAIQGKFDVLVTIDRGFEFQHNLSKLSFGIVIVMREGIGWNTTVHYSPSFPPLWTRSGQGR